MTLLKVTILIYHAVNGEAEAYADQMVFWVFNDVGNQHSESSGQAIGVQINALAFAFQTTDEINNMTFLQISDCQPKPLIRYSRLTLHSGATRI
jgi:hypothetical protein